MSQVRKVKFQDIEAARTFWAGVRDRWDAEHPEDKVNAHSTDEQGRPYVHCWLNAKGEVKDSCYITSEGRTSDTFSDLKGRPVEVEVVGQPWYEDPNSQCPECGHGPQWHNDPSGCTRMVAGWCSCTRVYGPFSQGPEDRITSERTVVLTTRVLSLTDGTYEFSQSVWDGQEPTGWMWKHRSRNARDSHGAGSFPTLQAAQADALQHRC